MFSIKDDSGREYDISLSFNLSPNQMQDMLNYVSDPARGYDLNNFNCTHFAIEAFRQAGVNLPRTAGSWLYGGGLNPGSLGKDLRSYFGNQVASDVDGGVSIGVNGNCQ